MSLPTSTLAALLQTAHPSQGSRPGLLFHTSGVHVLKLPSVPTSGSPEHGAGEEKPRDRNPSSLRRLSILPTCCCGAIATTPTLWVCLGQPANRPPDPAQRGVTRLRGQAGSHIQSTKP